MFRQHLVSERRASRPHRAGLPGRPGRAAGVRLSGAPRPPRPPRGPAARPPSWTPAPAAGTWPACSGATTADHRPQAVLAAHVLSPAGPPAQCWPPAARWPRLRAPQARPPPAGVPGQGGGQPACWMPPTPADGPRGDPPSEARDQALLRGAVRRRPAHLRGAATWTWATSLRDGGGGLVSVRQGKGRKDRMVPLGRPALAGPRALPAPARRACWPPPRPAGPPSRPVPHRAAGAWIRARPAGSWPAG